MSSPFLNQVRAIRIPPWNPCSIVAVFFERLLVESEKMRNLVRERDLDLLRQLLSMKKILFKRSLINADDGRKRTDLAERSFRERRPDEYAVDDLIAIPEQLFHEPRIGPILDDDFNILQRVAKLLRDSLQCLLNQCVKLAPLHRFTVARKRAIRFIGAVLVIA